MFCAARFLVLSDEVSFLLAYLEWRSLGLEKHTKDLKFLGFGSRAGKHINKIFTGLSRDYPRIVPGLFCFFPWDFLGILFMCSLFSQEKEKLFMFIGFFVPQRSSPGGGGSREVSKKGGGTNRHPLHRVEHVFNTQSTVQPLAGPSNRGYSLHHP